MDHSHQSLTRLVTLTPGGAIIIMAAVLWLRAHSPWGVFIIVSPLPRSRRLNRCGTLTERRKLGMGEGWGVGKHLITHSLTPPESLITCPGRELVYLGTQRLASDHSWKRPVSACGHLCSSS
ncbi:hypothetical protein RRG08_022289 [Elysia crispata]|uniref:Uncharacterized protein n=1 Tax=Elysia crispata TaxID=231223 RepID=A0AAE1DKX0_9GAST|nr:hypothetical protein RRG08_022289 [Elysia crispata]